jgi:hypothetical protein
VLRSEIELPRLVYLTVGAAARDGELHIDGVELPSTAVAGGRAFARALVEFNAAQVAASAGRTHLVVRGVRGALGGAPVIGYTDSRGTVAEKLSFEVSGNHNSGAAARVLASVSGGNITRVRQFTVRDNSNLQPPAIEE